VTQEAFPEIQAATEALEKQIALTETEIDQMKETIAGKKQLVEDGARLSWPSIRNREDKRRGQRPISPDPTLSRSGATLRRWRSSLALLCGCLRTHLVHHVPT
jgi:hypothetical protein